MSTIPQTHRRRRDFTFPFVLALLLVFPIFVDRMFVGLKDALRATGGLGGLIAVPDSGTAAVPPRPQHCRGPLHSGKGYDPGWPLCPESGALEAKAGTTGSGSLPGSRGGFSEAGGQSGVAALEELERRRWDQIRELREAAQRRPGAESWVPIEPMPSNPSRFFPEYQHPQLSSGVRLTTSPDDPHWVDPPPPQPAPAFPLPPPRAIAAAAPPPVLQQPPQPTPQAPPVARAPASSPPGEETPRLSFKVKREVSNRSEERLIEVCGRMVPERLAPEASFECYKKDHPEKAKAEDESGGDAVILP